MIIKTSEIICYLKDDIAKNKKMNEKQFTTILNENTIPLHSDLGNGVLKRIKNKITFKNVATYYQIAKCFNSKILYVKTFSYIERFFAEVCDTGNFFELDFNKVAQIISSSELRVDTELEVLYAADSWIKYDLEKRRKNAKGLLLKVRFPMLLDIHLKCILKMDLSFNKIDDCVALLRGVSQKTNRAYQKKSNAFYSKRFCNQNSFNIVLSGGYKFDSDWNLKTLNRVQKVSCKSLSISKKSVK